MPFLETPEANGKKLYLFGELHPENLYTNLMEQIVKSAQAQIGSYSPERRRATMGELREDLQLLDEQNAQRFQMALGEEDAVEAYTQAFDDALTQLITIVHPHLETYRRTRFEECRIIAKETTSTTWMHERTLLERLKPECVYWEGNGVLDRPLPMYAQRYGIRNIFLDQDEALHDRLFNVNTNTEYDALQRKREQNWIEYISYGGNTELLIAGLQHVQGTWGLLDLLGKKGVPTQRVDTDISESIVKRAMQLL